MKGAAATRPATDTSAVAARQVADGTSLVGRDAAGDEVEDQSLVIDDAERRVLGASELAHPIDDELQDLLHFEHAADAARGGVEILKRRRKDPTVRLRSGIARQQTTPSRLVSQSGQGNVVYARSRRGSL